MYETYYNFKARPFQLRPDPRFFFNSATHKRAMAYMRYGLTQADGFIVITGDVGTGKTTLVSTLFRYLDSSKVIAARLVNTQLQPDDLLRFLAAEFGLPYKQVSKAELLKGLEVFFRTCAQERKRVLLVVDEAQSLPASAIEELRMLSNFEWNGKPLIQNFLLGQREFRIRLRTEGFEQLRQRVIAAYHLRPLDALETRAYIEHRLKLVGWKQDPIIDVAAYDDIFRFTQGVPRKINVFCDRLLLYASLEELHEIGHDSIQVVVDDIQEELWRSGDTQEFLENRNDHLLDSNLETRLSRTSLEQNMPLGQEMSNALLKEKPSPANLNHSFNEVERSITLLADTLRSELIRFREAVLKDLKTKE